jgi:hypothetical protein
LMFIKDFNTKSRGILEIDTRVKSKFAWRSWFKMWRDGKIKLTWNYYIQWMHLKMTFYVNFKYFRKEYHAPNPHRCPQHIYWYPYTYLFSKYSLFSLLRVSISEITVVIFIICKI